MMPFTVREEHLPLYRNDRNHWLEVYEGLVVPSVTGAGLVCERDDQDLKSRLIIDSIWRKIELADVVLCDLSGANPNVYLELGWALRADKRFVLIKDDITPISFDLNQHFTLTYNHSLQPTVLKQNIEKLSKVLAKTLADDLRAYSIVSRMELPVIDDRLNSPLHQNELVRVLQTRFNVPFSAISDQLRQSKTIRQFAYKIAAFSTVRFCADELLVLFKKGSGAIDDLNKAGAMLGLPEIKNDLDSNTFEEAQGERSA